MQSGLTYLAISGLISGSGLAKAKMTGLGFKALICSSLKAPPAETPMRTSHP